MKKALLLLGFTSFIYAQEFPVLKGDYFGQTPPGDTPVVFARGIVSTNDKSHSAPAFSPDGNEVFWWVLRPSGPNNEEWLSWSMTMQRIGNRWTTPEMSPYGNGAVFSPDGNLLYFNADEDAPCYVEKQDNNWSEPKCLCLVDSFPELQFVSFLSIANNGTLYFVGYAKGFWSDCGIYRSERINGEYAEPEFLPEKINIPGSVRNWTPFIAPDESYLIFSSTRGTSAYDEGDLYVCFRLPDGSWTDPVSLGKPINSNLLERFPSLSPDGKYLFFTRWSPDHDEDVFWVSAKIIDDIKKEVFNP